MEEESNPWPSFVDTFSSVLCIFIFIMLIFVLNNMLIVYDSSTKSYNVDKKSDQQPVASVTTSSADQSSNNSSVEKAETSNLDGESKEKETAYAAEVGSFDVGNAEKINLTVTDKALTILYHGKLKGYPKQDILKIIEWLKKKRKKNFEIELFVSQSEISFSDSLRLAYERGITLMQEIKSLSPDFILNISVNVTSASLENKAVITPKS